MLKNEFLEMMKQDLETNDNKMVKALHCVFEEVLSLYPDNTEIDNKLTVIECYKEMKAYARKNAQDGMFAFTPSEAEEFVRYYLKLNKVECVNKHVNLEDFL